MSKKIKALIIVVSLILASYVYLTYFVKHNKVRYLKNHSTKLYSPELTTLNIPVFLAVNDLQKLTNKKLKKVLVDKIQPLKNQKDSLHLKVERIGDLKFNLKNEKLHSSIQLKIDVVIIKKIGNSSLKIFNKEPLSFQIQADLISIVNLQEDLKIKSKTTLENLRWKEEPTAKIAGINVNLKNLVEKNILNQAAQITSNVDQLIQSKVNLRKPIEKIWNNLQKNLKVNKEEKNIFVKIQPQSLAVNVDKSLGDSLRLNVEVNSKLFVRYGVDTNQIQKIPFPKKIKIIKNYEPNKTNTVHLHALLPIHQINAILNKRIAGKKISVKGFNFTLSTISVFNAQKNIIGKLTISGDLNGEILVKGLPKISKDQRNISIKNIGIESKLNENLVNNITDLLHAEILQILNQNANFDISQLVNNLPELARTGLQKTKFVKKVDVNLNDLKIDDVAIHLTANNIQLLIDATTDFDISIKKEALKLKKIPK